MTIPIEFTVIGKPSSVNSTSVKKLKWKVSVINAANTELRAKYPFGHVPPPHVGDVTVKVFFFPHTQQYLDVDNGLKHTIDGFSPPILKNDRSVVRLIAERFSPLPGASLFVPIKIAPILRNAIAIASGQASVMAGKPFKREYATVTVVKVESYEYNSGEFW